MKQHDLAFKGFYAELNYWDRLDKCIENFDSLITSIPDEVKNRGAPQYYEDYIFLEVDDQDQLESSSTWAQRRKKQKMIEIPQVAWEGILKILPKGTTYFDEDRTRFLMRQANEEEGQKKLEREAKMMDDKIIKAHNFVKDDAFIRIEEFKNFLFKVKQNELSLQMDL